jgi:hypothetical protein
MMADWYGHARSSYFRVKDLAAFRVRMKQLGLEVIGKNPDDTTGADGRVALLSTDVDQGGLPQGYYDEQQDACVDVDLVDEIAQHLADGEVAVLVECGAEEKLRYLTGVAIAVNNKSETRRVSLDDIYPLAHELGPNVTEAEY